MQYLCQYFHISLQNGHLPRQLSITTFCYSHSCCKLFQFPSSILYFCIQKVVTHFWSHQKTVYSMKNLVSKTESGILHHILCSLWTYNSTSHLVIADDHPRDKGSRLLWNVSILLPHYQKAVTFNSIQFITTKCFVLISYTYNSVCHNSLFW